MKITDISRQKRNAGRFSIFVDNKYSFSLSDNELLNQKIKIGDELSREKLAELQAVSQQDKIYSKTLSLIARRPRSEHELRQYLKRNKVEFEQAEIILNKLSRLGYVDDEDFARRWVENRRLLKLSSKRKLRQELKAKGVKDSIINQVIKDDETEEQEVIKELINKKRQTTRYKDPQKLMQYLARQGFNYGDIKQALEEE